jgi:spore coat polysaccharide biosynthesis predicted glycosyltransferase SpsG
MNRGSILLRVDGSADDGMGKVARCLALANALQRRRYQMTFMSRIDNHAWPDRIRRHRHNVLRTNHAAGSVADRAELMREVETRQPQVVVTDSIEFDEEFLAMLSYRVPLVISIDAVAGIRFPSDIVLSPTLTCDANDFQVYPGTQVLAGERYALVRSEFRRARNVRATEPGGAVRILLSLGGGEVGHDTARLAATLLEEKSIEKVDAVIGSSTEGRDELKLLVERFPGRLSIISDCRDLAMRITKSHLLVCGGGNTPVEAACVGIPTVVVVRRPDQAAHAEKLEEIGIAQNMGDLDAAAPERVAKAVVEILADNFERKAMSRSGRMLIDGRGGDRLVTATEILLRRTRRSKSMPAAA